MRQLILSLILLLFVVPVAAAQDNSIAAGDVISGEITEQDYAFLYTFQAEAGDILVFELLGIEPSQDGLDDPELIILGLEREVLVTTDGMFQAMGGYGAAYLGFVAPDAGRFSVIATRKSGVDGDSVGNFELRMYQPTILEAGQPIEGRITSEDTHNFYVFTPDEEAFSLGYERLGGDYSPEVSVNTLNDEGELTGLAYLNGGNLTAGTVGFFDEAVPHFIMVGEQTLGFGGFGFETTTADYTLEVMLDRDK